MFKKILLIMSVIMMSFIIPANAETKKASKSVQELLPLADNLEASILDMDAEETNARFMTFKQQWQKVKGEVREESPESVNILESNIALLSISILNGEWEDSSEHIKALSTDLKAYAEGSLNTDMTAIEKKSLSSYIALLKDTKESVDNQDIGALKTQVEQLRTEWLTVEGDVVSQSQTVYNNSEQALVLMAGYLEKGEGKLAEIGKLADQMIFELEPLQKDSYGIWDAAFIPIREGVEALLVVAALLSFTKKSNNVKGGRWIWGGAIAGLAVSIGIGIIVTYILTAVSFGENNFLINGFSGIIASLMLLYVSYWLHRNANVHQWNHFMKDKAEKGISRGKMATFAGLAFLAILREGMETVIFLIGLVNRMPMEKLISGILLGFGILIIIAVLMLKVGTKLPLKPFFLVSGAIVFYMCFKFMGSGIHSLQLAGFLKSTVNEEIPAVSFLGIYPSWYSTLPQLLICILAGTVILYNFIKNKKQKNIGGNLS